MSDYMFIIPNISGGYTRYDETGKIIDTDYHLKDIVERFFRYVRIDTQSDEESETRPSTAKQRDLAKLLFTELNEMGAEDVELDWDSCYVYAKIPATDGGAQTKTLGFIAHMDTSPEVTDENVNPKIIENYDGEDIELNEELGVVMEVDKFPELKNYVGKTLVVTDGTTLLGADDKAGIAEIMTMADVLLKNPEIKHGPIAIAFTPDEEIGAGTENFSLEKFGADYAYTVDGGALGELEYETFNAASAAVEISGISVHTGDAKDKMVNAARLAAEFDSMLPAGERPEFTEGREGFFHLLNIQGETEHAKLNYLVRDHDREKFEARKARLKEIAYEMNDRYGDDYVKVEITDSYYNMREKIEPEFMFLVDNVVKCMKELGVEPIIKPIRGGTDGSALSFMGLPCPNICTGGHNFHGRYEYCCVESMEKIAELLVELAKTL